ncbi:nSTAND1 domain-containing NTPase [Embleya sp. MST-111070]|uniref:nSTAND1 domain-containing NTPase n=1 Tax=Embleya sp. MST-111070 TaxID=3398231 RepID=UPI003F73202E
MPGAVAQVRDGVGTVVGAGFLIAEDLLVTCAHVLVDGGYGPGAVVGLVFPHAPGAPAVAGRVLEEPWRGPREQDVALVALERSVGVAPLSLGSAAGCRGHRVRSFGFPQQAPPGGHFGFATAGELLPAVDDSGDLLQLTGANDLTTGFSGGPVLDEVSGLVVGMLTAITAPDVHDRGQGIAYVTPTTVLRQVWPVLDERDVSPYRALEPFTAEHARWFRGRAEAVRQVLTALGGRRRVVLLLGPSGSGKSSLVQAGVLPALAAGRLPGSDRWRPVVVRPGRDLPAALEQAGLTGAATAGIGAAVSDLLAVDPDHDRVVLVVDQFEELLASSAGTRALESLDRITAAIRSDARLGVVLVMRDDFYSRLSASAPDLLRAALPGLLNVPTTLNGGELEEIVTGPADDLGAPFEPGLAQRIISDVLALNPRTAAGLEAPVTVLPLLEVTLSRLWERRRDHDGRLAHDAYRRLGAVTGALADWCDTALGELDEPRRRIAQRVLTALVRPADDARHIPAVRQQLPLDELRDLAADSDTPAGFDAVDEVVAVLARHRLVATDRAHVPGRAGDPTGVPVADLIHDALIRDWDTLRRWVGQDARFHDWLHRARTQHARWQESRHPQDLPAGTLLTEGNDWSHQRRLPTDLKTFLEAGRRHQQAAIRRSRRLNVILASVLALALIASGLALWQRQTAITARHTADAQRHAADTQRRVAQSRQLAAQSASLIDTNPDLASLLAIGAYRTSPTTEAIGSLQTAVQLPLRRRLASHGDAMNSMVFSPDGHTLVTSAHDDTVRLWDVATGNPLTPLAGDTKDVESVAFSPDGRTLATGGFDKTVRLWDVATRNLLTTLTGHTNTVASVAFSPDGHTLATSGGLDKTVRLWDVATGKTLTTLTGHTNAVYSVEFGPDGRTLATNGDDHTARLWDAATGKSLTTFTDVTRPVEFGPDGHTLATASDDGTVRLWDATGRPLTTLTGHTAVKSVAFGPDGHTLATGSGDGTVRLWDVATGITLTTLTPHTEAGHDEHTDGVFSVAFSPDGHTLATGSADKTVRLWDVATGKLLGTRAGHLDFVFSVAFSPDGRTLASLGKDFTVRLWDVTGKTPTTLTGHASDVNSVAFSPDGHTLATSGGLDKTVRLWDVATGKTLITLTTYTGDNPNDGAVDSVAFSPDGHTLAAGTRDGTRLWDVATGKPLPGQIRGAVDSVAFSPDGHTLAIGTRDGTQLWDVATGKPLATLTTYTGDNPNDGAVDSVAFSPDGHTLAAGGFDKTVRLWDVATAKNFATLTGHTAAVTSVAFSPDGHTLATGSIYDDTVRLWDVATARTLATLTHAGISVAFSPDGHTLATGSADKTVRLWDVATAKNFATLIGHTEGVNSVAFSPDGHTVASTGNDRTVRLWPFTLPDAAADVLCKAVARDLTPYEKDRYLPQQNVGLNICSG